MHGLLYTFAVIFVSILSERMEYTTLYYSYSNSLSVFSTYNIVLARWNIKRSGVFLSRKKKKIKRRRKRGAEYIVTWFYSFDSFVLKWNTAILKFSCYYLPFQTNPCDIITQTSKESQGEKIENKLSD